MYSLHGSNDQGLETRQITFGHGISYKLQCIALLLYIITGAIKGCFAWKEFVQWRSEAALEKIAAREKKAVSPFGFQSVIEVPTRKVNSSIKKPTSYLAGTISKGDLVQLRPGVGMPGWSEDDYLVVRSVSHGMVMVWHKNPKNTKNFAKEELHRLPPWSEKQWYVGRYLLHWNLTVICHRTGQIVFRFGCQATTARFAEDSTGLLLPLKCDHEDPSACSTAHRYKPDLIKDSPTYGDVMAELSENNKTGNFFVRRSDNGDREAYVDVLAITFTSSQGKTRAARIFVEKRSRVSQHLIPRFDTAVFGDCASPDQMSVMK